MNKLNLGSIFKYLNISNMQLFVLMKSEISPFEIIFQASEVKWDFDNYFIEIGI